MKKRLFQCFTALLLFICLSFSLGMLLFGPAKAGANEVLAAAPSLTERDGSFNTTFLNDLSDYVGDRFLLRQECITAWNALNASLLRTSTAEDVILGSDGWLFYGQTLGDYTGTALLSDRELWCAARTLYLMQEQVTARGGEFLFLAAPNKNSLYGDYMPELPVVSAQRNASRLHALLDEMGVAYLDLFSLFAAREEPLYFRWDSHWNSEGAALAADAILDGFGRESSYADGPFRTENSHTGDLYQMLRPAGTARESDSLPVDAPVFEITNGATRSDSMTIETASAGEDSLFLFRDSFGSNLYPYLAEAFRSAVFSRRATYDMRLAADADCVAVELVERNLHYLLDYPPVLPAPARELSTAEAVESKACLLARGEYNAAWEGCWELSVSEGLPADADSPVWVILPDGNVYEALPAAAGFTASIPGAADAPPSARAAALVNGVLTFFPLVY